MNEKPEALQFADDRPSSWNVDDLYQWASDAEELIRSMQARITDLEKENASLKQDTVRYRWLSAQHWVEPEAVFRLGLSDTDDFGEYQRELDAAIDTAMKKD